MTRKNEDNEGRNTLRRRKRANAKPLSDVYTLSVIHLTFDGLPLRDNHLMTFATTIVQIRSIRGNTYNSSTRGRWLGTGLGDVPYSELGRRASGI